MRSVTISIVLMMVDRFLLRSERLEVQLRRQLDVGAEPIRPPSRFRNYAAGPFKRLMDGRSHRHCRRVLQEATVVSFPPQPFSAV